VTTLVFVYGTLKRGDCRHEAIAEQEFLGEVETLPEYRMVNCGAYPGLIAADDGCPVQGELWRVSDECLRQLDDVEGVDEGLYARRTVRLKPPAHELAVEAYFYLPVTAHLPDCGVCWPVQGPADRHHGR
jgi:gamma-glutamylaminecyclotransferase